MGCALASCQRLMRKLRLRVKLGELIGYLIYRNRFKINHNKSFALLKALELHQSCRFCILLKLNLTTIMSSFCQASVTMVIVTSAFLILINSLKALECKYIYHAVETSYKHHQTKTIFSTAKDTFNINFSQTNRS